MGEPIKIWGVAPMTLHKGVQGEDEWTCLVADRYPSKFHAICWHTQADPHTGAPAGAQLALFQGECDPALALDLQAEKDVILLSDPRASADLAARLADPTGLQTKLVAAGVLAELFEAKAEPTLNDAANAVWRTIYGKQVTDERPPMPKEIPRGSATDDFTGADDAAILNKALSGGTYTWVSCGLGTNAVILSNTFRAKGAIDWKEGYFGINPAVNWQDCYAQALLYAMGANDGNSMVAIRTADVNNKIWAYRKVNTVYLAKWVAGVNTAMGNYATGDAGNWTCKLDGTGINPGTILVYINGTLRIGSAGNGDNALDSGNVGMGGYYHNTTDYGRLDDFEAAEAGGGGYTVPLAHILEAAA